IDSDQIHQCGSDNGLNVSTSHSLGSEKVQNLDTDQAEVFEQGHLQKNSIGERILVDGSTQDQSSKSKFKNKSSKKRRDAIKKLEALKDASISPRNPLFMDSQEGLSSTPDPETPIENPVPIACDHLDPVFAVCNLNTSGSRDFEADEYRQIISEDETEYDSEEEPKNTSDDAHVMQLLQTFGATTSQMSETHVKEVTDRQGLSPRGASHFSPGFGTSPPATRTRLKAKTRHPID
ncbi:hypothetical protein HAX54_042141, partial [Datura stramonium]|nr:hypothetical protein [Datura stramonium]